MQAVLGLVKDAAGGPFEMAVIDDGVSNLRLNWWPATGELQLTGEPAQREPLLARLQAAL